MATLNICANRVISEADHEKNCLRALRGGLRINWS